MRFFMSVTKYRVAGIILACSTLISSSVLASSPGNDKREFTAEFDCPDNIFTDSGTNNKFFPLVMNDEKDYSNQSCVDEGECDELEEVKITVTTDTVVVDGVLTRIVTEEEWEDGILVEESFNFFAICVATSDVFYFGEDVINYIYDEDECEDGFDEGEEYCTNDESAWKADETDASPGVIMPGSFMLGARYFQEIHPNAMDRGENVAMGLSITVPVGAFSDCVQVNDTNALEDPKGKEFDEKIYCPGVGIVMDEELELISITP